MFTTSNTVLIVIVAVWLLTLGRSLLIMCGGNKLFEKALKGGKSAYMPIINLFVMLEIVDLSSFLGILLFIPGINVIILMIMSYKLGKVFEKSTSFTLGLVFLPIVFYLLLFRSDLKYKYRDENYFLSLNESAKADSINLMTEDEINELNNTFEIQEPVVDSIFKSKFETMEPVESYKAAKIDREILNRMDKLEFNDNTFEPIKKVENTSNVYENTFEGENSTDNTKNSGSSKFISELDKKDEIEFIDL